MQRRPTNRKHYCNRMHVFSDVRLSPFYDTSREERLLTFLRDLSSPKSFDTSLAIDLLIDLFIREEKGEFYLFYYKHNIIEQYIFSSMPKTNENKETEQIEILSSIIERLTEIQSLMSERMPCFHTPKTYVSRRKRTLSHAYVYPRLMRVIASIINAIDTERIRIRYFDKSMLAPIREVAGLAKEKYNEAEALAGEASSSLCEANERASKLSSELSTFRTEIITILGIFSSIVIAFSGGFSILGNAISSLPNVSIYKALIAILSCTIGLFNTIFILLYVVAKMTGKSLSNQCPEAPHPVKIDSLAVCRNCMKERDKRDKHDKHDCKDNLECAHCDKRIWSCPTGNRSTWSGACRHCNSIRRLQRKLPYVFWFNILLLIAVFLVAFLWFFEFPGLELSSKPYESPSDNPAITEVPSDYYTYPSAYKPISIDPELSLPPSADVSATLIPSVSTNLSSEITDDGG